MIKIVFRKPQPNGEGIIATVDWPPGFDVPRLGEGVNLSGYGIEGWVKRVVWNAETPDGYPHMTEWHVSIELG